MLRRNHFLPDNIQHNLHTAKSRYGEFFVTLKSDLKSITSIRKGSQLSRLIRHSLSRLNIKKLAGKNLAYALILSSLITKPTFTDFNDPKDVSHPGNTPLVIHTNITTRYPVESVHLTQKYSLVHPGIDLDGVTGDNVYPILEGVVADIQYSKVGYGNAILINHPNGLTTLYAHLSKIYVIKDESVKTTSIIGLMGATGRATGDHLHFEVRKNGVLVNPLSVLNQ